MKKIFMGDLHSHLRKSGYPFSLYNHLSSSKKAIEENYIKKAKQEVLAECIQFSKNKISFKKIF